VYRPGDPPSSFHSGRDRSDRPQGGSGPERGGPDGPRHVRRRAHGGCLDDGSAAGSPVHVAMRGVAFRSTAVRRPG